MPNNSAGRHRTRTMMIAGAGICLLVLAVFGVVAYQQGLRPAGSSTTQVTFTVSAGENAQTIADHLLAAGLIRDRNAFITYVNLHGLRPKLKTGSYHLNAAMTGPRIAEIIASGATITERLLVPEGYRLAQIETATAALGIPKAEFEAALAEPHSQGFLSGKPAGVSLEGYLFPDSYEVNANTTASRLVNTMLDNFGRNVGAAYTQAFAAQGLTLHQGLTIASIVEREVNIAADRPVVAQIFLKRFRSGQALGSDVTVQYAADLRGLPFNLQIDSPYNTRRFAGLPPGPICSPGLAALDAVAKPANTDYLYFLTGKDGKTYFAKTYTEHQANIAKRM